MQNQTRNGVYIIACVAGLLLLGGASVARAQVSLPGLPAGIDRTPLERDLDRELPRRVREDTEDRVEQAAEEAERTAQSAAKAVEDTATEVTERAETLVEAASQAAGDAVDLAAGALREFVPGTDPAGLDIEDEIVVLLVEPGQADLVGAGGEQVLARQELAALGLTMLTVRRPAGRTLPQTVEDLRNALPDAAVDFNHVYRYATGSDAADGAAEDATVESEPEPEAADTRLRVGIVDSAVLPDHHAFRDTHIVARDFAAHEGERPATHGTAVASLVARSTGDAGEIYAASVFFQLPGYAPGATTESLVAALDWLVTENVDVINMSLAGPGNALLETAIEKLQANGALIVAAVGNNGPAGEPLYPAAYEGVIGVTAVDRDERIFRYANRGPHVDCAAEGVNVKVADSETGGWRIESGTSMASPHVAVIAGLTRREAQVEAGAVLSWLIASAKDLGRRGHDPVFGHGLVTRPPVVVSSN
ncbi:MAG: S8 family serine peptidase [Woeseiaceae bacterium]|nr:S8 family serine peptidase [Woeseiaceae bacterium]